MDKEQKRNVENALINFIIRVAENETAPAAVVQTLPEAVHALVDFSNRIIPKD